MHSVGLSDNKIIHCQLVFITNFVAVTEKAELSSFFFSEKVYHFPLFPAGNSIIHKTGDCTVLIEAYANRKSLEGGQKTLPMGEKAVPVELNH